VRSTGLGRNISAACWRATATMCGNIRWRPSAYCATEPALVARRLVDRGLTGRYDDALQMFNDLPYDKWREYDAEDTVRFYALRLCEAGMIKSDPKKIITETTDWRFLNEL
jgi:NitT/TauT family transport system substrate-binding protein